MKFALVLLAIPVLAQYRVNVPGSGEQSAFQAENSTTAGGSCFAFKVTNTSGGARHDAGRLCGIFDGTTYGTNRVTIQYGTADGTFVDAMTIQNGRIGIGTNSPAAHVEINGGVTRIDNGSLSMFDSMSHTSVIASSLSTSGGTVEVFVPGTFHFAELTFTGIATDLNISNSIFFASPTAVGIGTGSPSELLDITGGNFIVHDGGGLTNVELFSNAGGGIVTVTGQGVNAGNTTTITSLGLVTNGNINAFGQYFAGLAPGVTCSGTPTASFASTVGIVTHC